MFAYCNNAPVIYKDSSGNALDTVFDVVSLCFSIVEVASNPADVGAWIGLAGDIIDVAVPFVAGVGEAVRAVNASRKIADAADKANDARKVVNKIHGNSLNYPGKNYGYILSDKTTGEVVKFGETINPDHRYTKKFLDGENPIEKPLDMTVVTSGTKRDVHTWQHKQIVDFYFTVGELPKLNLNFY